MVGRAKRFAPLAIITLSLAACGGAGAGQVVEPPRVTSGESVMVEPASSPAPSIEPTPATTAAATVPPTTVAPSTLPPTTLPPTTLPPTTLAPEVYQATVSEIDAAVAAEITPSSWREGCPVTLEELRLIELNYINYEGNVAFGRLIVHRDHADSLAQVFGVLFDARFPIQSMELVDAFGGDDQRSMQANNTSAFNCREVAYTPGRWSNHAFGQAIDINPLVNPYVKNDFVDPEQGRAYLDRTSDTPGLIKADDVVVQAFAEVGWIWGGTWSSAKDYQHFSANGR